MNQADMQEPSSDGFLGALRDNAAQIGVTAAIGAIGFVTTLLVLNDPGVETMVPVMMAASTAIFTLVAADVVERPLRTVVVLAGLMLFGYLCAMSLAIPVSGDDPFGPCQDDDLRSRSAARRHDR